MTDVSDLVGAFKREVAPLGSFEQDFPTASDGAVIGLLMDAFGEAQLDGFFQTMVLDVDDETVTPDLSAAGAALVVLYAGIKTLRNQILRAGAGSKFKAGPVEYQTTQNMQAQTEMLKQLERRRDALIGQARQGATPVYQIDAYSARGLAAVGGFAPHELRTGGW